MKKSTLLMMLMSFFMTSLLLTAQNEPPDFPNLSPGPIPNYSLTNGANTYSGNVSTPSDSQDAFSTTLGVGQTITSIVFSATGGGGTGSYSFGGFGAGVAFPGGTINSDPSFTMPGTYNNIISTGFSTGTNWNLTINVTSSCTSPTVPTITATPSTVCTGSTSTLNISGTLNDATAWSVYTGSCGGTLVGTTTTSTFVVTPAGASTTYFVRGEGGCVTPGSCGSVTVNTTAIDDASFNYDAAAYCADDTDPTPTITGLAGGTFSSTAGLSLNAANGTVDVSASTPGTYTVTYTTAGACPNSSNVSVTVNALDDASFNYAAAAYCADDTDPTPTITGLAGGTFSSTAGLSINAANGTVDVSASTPGTYTVTYTTAGTCPNSSNVSVTVNALDDASFNYAAAAYCADDTDPTPTITGLAGGTFSSTAGLSLNAANGTVDVSASTPGTYTVTYTTAGTCPNSSNVSVTVNALDDASFNYDAAAYCVDDTDPTPTITGLAGGTFSSTAGLSINAANGTVDVSASTPGTYTVTYTTAGTCPNSSNVSVTVNALDDASFNYDAAAYCAYDTDPTPTITGLAGGTFSSTAGLSINAANGTVDVSASTPGTYTVTYTTAGTCPNSSNVSVTVNALDDASFNYDAAAYCADDTDPTPTITGLAGGTFSSTAGLSMNAANGTVDVSASTPGTYTVTYTTVGTCPNSSNVSVTVNALPTVTFTAPASPFCPNSTTTNLGGGSPVGGVYSGAGVTDDGNGTTFTFDSGASGNGTHTLTYTFTDGNSCTNSASDTITVEDNEDPVISCPGDITQENDLGECGAVVTYSVTATDNCTLMNPTPAGFTYLGQDNGNDYYLSDTPFTPPNAFADAIAKGGFVASIANAAQNEFIRAAIAAITSGISPMLGLNDVALEGSFEWQDGSPVSYTNWTPGEPNNSGNEDYTEIDLNNGRWNDYPNFVSKQYVLQLPVGPVQTAGLPSGSTFPVGTTTNTFVVTDASGNTATCSFDVTINDTEAPVFADIYGDGTLSNPFTSIQPEIVGSVATGTYYFSFNGSTFQGVLDNDTDGGGWLMILNYVHQAGDNSNLQVRNTDLPLLGASTIGTSEAASPSWGHFGNALAADIDFEEVRFYAQTSRDPNNIIDFTTDYSAVSNYVKTGNGSFAGINNPANYTLGTSHNSSIPQNAPDFFSNEGDFALTNFPFWRAGQAHWGIRGLGNRWEVDDFSLNNFSTIHRVWVRGDLSPSSIVGSTTITVQLDASGNVTITAADFGLTAVDNCSTVTQTLSITDFDCSNIGSNTIQLTASDVVGNERIIDVIVNVEDNIDPVITCAANDTRDTNPGVCEYTVVGTEFDATFTDNCTDGSITNDLNGTATIDGEVLPKGVTTVVWTVDDGNGQMASCTTVITVEDNEDPIISCIANDTRDTDPGICEYTVVGTEFDATFTDNCADGSITNDLNGTATIDGEILPTGDTIVVWTVDDGNGQSATCTTVITVEDNEAPIIACPADLAANTDPTICGAVVFFPDAIALDNCGVASVIQTAGLPSGSLFPVGVSVVEYTATDVNGNMTICDFTITVTDNEAPVTVCQDITIQLDANGNAMIVAADVDGGSTDNCGIDSISIDIDTFDCSNVGPNDVTLSVTDVNGNTATCIAVVTVEEVTAPVVVCQDITVELDASGTVTITGTDVDGGSTDACGIASYELDMSTFDCSNVGTNDVILTVTDVNGNVATCNAVVTVEDNTSPVLVCMDITLELNADGTATITPADVIANNDDACGILTTAVDITNFDCSDIGTPVTVQVFSQDNNGNLATCFATVTVIDLLAPELTCPADQSQDPGVGNLFYEVPDYFATGEATAIDNCTDPVTILTQDPAAGTLLPDGIYTVTFTAEDEYGNTSTCDFQLTIESILGVNEVALSLNTVSIYPNPANDVVYLSNPQGIELNQAIIYDMRGRKIDTIDLRNMGVEKSIDISNLASATYNVQIITDNAVANLRLLKE
ncbi:HYR domain-containing protein [Ulvibacter antarcticus]|uniref:Putative secreted protein (Por secretion system target) n=1 Tax=Ulvibacter antarcticus TaxID=442714 RepID=A0A3L9YG36_9FLAO|nr:HYR domain-containing protein [Ulvibacter antarcticus]RMA58477.1 putative secreted protein (Por secretion system target) [Ulvibacter antarcticus]